MRKPAVPRFRQGPSTSTLQHNPPPARSIGGGPTNITASTSAVLKNPQMSYVAPVGCNHVPEEYLTMLEASAPLATAGLSSVEHIEPLTPDSSPPPPVTQERRQPPKTIVRPIRTSPRSLPHAVVPPMPSVDPGDVEMLPVQRQPQPSAVRHHHIPISSRGELCYFLVSSLKATQGYKKIKWAIF